MKLLATTVLAAAFSSASVAHGALIAYWDQNSNGLPTSGFGFTATSFPQAADQGSGSLTLEDFDLTVGGADDAYSYIPSFGGTTENAQPTIDAGGSLSVQGAASNANNGMSIILSVETTGFTDITVSWAQRGTASGFTSRQFDYSLNGIDWTNVDTDSGALSATWVTEVYDLSVIDAIEEQATVYFRIVLDGATGTTGNNRFDNITVEGVPEPSAALLGGLGLLGILRRRR